MEEINRCLILKVLWSALPTPELHIRKVRLKKQNLQRWQTVRNVPLNAATIWGYSSAGRAPALQAGGQRFDPVYLHHRARVRTESGIMGL